MIEFKKDGPFGSPRRDAAQDTILIGLGTAGLNILDQIVLEGEPSYRLLGLDTDEQAVKGSVVKETHLLGHQVLRGNGSGGDPSVAEEAFAQDAGVVRELVSGAKLALVVAGLGGGTASGALRPLLQLLKDAGASVVLLGFTPMAFEGTRRRMQARRALQSAEGLADAVLVLSNERMLNAPDRDLNLRSCFQMMNQLAGQSCLSLAQMLSGAQTPPAQLEQVSRMTCGGPAAAEPVWENCWAALAEAEGEGRAARAVEQILSSPLLADGQAWELGESLLAAVVAGQDVPVEEVREFLDRLQEELPRRLPVMAATAVDPDLSDTLSVVLMVARPMAWEAEEAAPEEVEAAAPVRAAKLPAPVPAVAAVKAAEKQEGPEEGEAGRAEPAQAGGELFGLEEAMAPGRRKGGRQNYFAEQEELPLNQKIDKGRFENSSPTVMNGEDLDVPTYMRMGVKIQARV
jgi:cell division protein FtsZ